MLLLTLSVEFLSLSFLISVSLDLNLSSMDRVNFSAMILFDRGLTAPLTMSRSNSYWALRTSVYLQWTEISC